jgi:hypothetical protein
MATNEFERNESSQTEGSAGLPPGARPVTAAQLRGRLSTPDPETEVKVDDTDQMGLPPGARPVSAKQLQTPQVRAQIEQNTIDEFLAPEVQELYQTLTGFTEELTKDPENEELLQEYRNYYDRNAVEIDRLVNLEGRVWEIMSNYTDVEPGIGAKVMEFGIKGVSVLAGTWSAFNRVASELIQIHQLTMRGGLPEEERREKVAEILSSLPAKTVESFNKAFAEDPDSILIDRPGSVLTETGVVPNAFQVPISNVNRYIEGMMVDSASVPNAAYLSGLLRAVVPFVSTDGETVTSNDILGILIELASPDPMISLLTKATRGLAGAVGKAKAPLSRMAKFFKGEEIAKTDDIVSEMLDQLVERTSIHPLFERIQSGAANPAEVAERLSRSQMMSETARQALRLEQDRLAKRIADFSAQKPRPLTVEDVTAKLARGEKLTDGEMVFLKTGKQSDLIPPEGVIEPGVITGDIGSAGAPPMQRTIYDAAGGEVPSLHIRMLPLNNRRLEIREALKTVTGSEKSVLQGEMRQIEKQLDEMVTDLNRAGMNNHKISPNVSAPPPERFESINEAVWFGENRMTDDIATQFYARRSQLGRELMDDTLSEVHRADIADQMTLLRESIESFKETKRLTYAGRSGSSEVSEISPGVAQVVRQSQDGRVVSEVFDETQIFHKIRRGEKLSTSELRHVKEDMHLAESTVKAIEEGKVYPLPKDSDVGFLGNIARGDLRFDRTTPLYAQQKYRDFLSRGYAIRKEGDILELTEKGRETLDAVVDLVYRAGVNPNDIKLENVSRLTKATDKLKSFAQTAKRDVVSSSLNNPSYGLAGLAAGFDLDEDGKVEVYHAESGLLGAALGVLLVAAMMKNPRMAKFTKNLLGDSKFAQKVMNSVDFSTGLHKGPRLAKLNEFKYLSKQQKDAIKVLGDEVGWTRQEINQFRSTGHYPQTVIDRTPAHLRPKERVAHYAVGDGTPSRVAKEVEDQYFVAASNNPVDIYASEFLKTGDLGLAIKKMGPLKLTDEFLEAVKNGEVLDFRKRGLDTLLHAQAMDGGSHWGVMRRQFYTAHSQATLAKVDFIGDEVEKIRAIKGNIRQGSTEDKLASIIGEYVSLADLTNITPNGLRNKLGDLTAKLQARKPELVEEIAALAKSRAALRAEGKSLGNVEVMRVWKEERLARRHLGEVEKYIQHINNVDK